MREDAFMFQVCIYGRGGQGVVTAEEMLSVAECPTGAITMVPEEI